MYFSQKIKITKDNLRKETFQTNFNLKQKKSSSHYLYMIHARIILHIIINIAKIHFNVQYYLKIFVFLIFTNLFIIYIKKTIHKQLNVLLLSKQIKKYLFILFSLTAQQFFYFIFFYFMSCISLNKKKTKKFIIYFRFCLQKSTHKNFIIFFLYSSNKQNKNNFVCFLSFIFVVINFSQICKQKTLGRN